MRRRDVLAGGASVGMLLGAGIAVRNGLPVGSEDDGRRSPSHDPVEVATVDAPGSDPGSITVPGDCTPMLVDLFATTCSICRDQMPILGKVHDRFADELTLVSVTNESKDAVDDEALAGWWADHGGRWLLARDPTSELIVHYGTSTPTAVLFDADGRVAWEDTGRKAESAFVENVRPVLDDDDPTA